MKISSHILITAILILVKPLWGQDSVNCFLNDFRPRSAVIPPYEDVDSITATATLKVTTNAADTLGKISKYIFGNSVAVWLGQNVNNPTIVKYLNLLSPTLIRFPGGSWSDYYFWNGNPGDLPDSIPDGTTYNYTTGSYKKIMFYPQYGQNQALTPDGYYDLRSKTGAQGLITINYAYARYGQSEHPVQQAAHLAADWVRYDNGRTKFWEIGNEDSAPWEAGWLIDISQNKDNQPPLISGDLYGKQFKVFADSMRTAAAELGDTIYIGGIVIENSSTYWIFAAKTWNQEFFSQVGDSADFYVIHDYFGSGSKTLKGQVDNGRTELNSDISFVRQNIANYNAANKPIALTEWNLDTQNGLTSAEASSANGMQAVSLFSEMAKHNIGMSCRWLIANWETDGMFYYGNNSGIPLWNPRPAFFYIYYLQKFTGDQSITTNVNPGQTYSDILIYASMFSNGNQGIILVNKGSTDQVVQLYPQNYGYGSRYYVYNLTGGDNTEFSQTVLVNDIGPNTPEWGPIDSLQNIKAYAFPSGDKILVNSPAKSVQFIMLEPGDNLVSIKDAEQINTVTKYKLNQNYPNPFNPTTKISYSLAKAGPVTLEIYDLLGRKEATIINNVFQSSGFHEISCNAENLPSGVYFYKLKAGNYINIKKMLLLK